MADFERARPSEMVRMGQWQVANTTVFEVQRSVAETEQGRESLYGRKGRIKKEKKN